MSDRASRGGLGPLFAWGETLRAAKARRRSLIARSAAVSALGLALAATIFVPPRPWLVWNASASVPRGLYAIGAPARAIRGAMVVARLPRRVREFAAARHYLPSDALLVKRVAAVAGDTVCASGTAILINGRKVAMRRARDRAGRVLPWWNGCVRLGPGQYFLLIAASPLSFDGRYFGATTRADLVGTATLLWAR